MKSTRTIAVIGGSQEGTFKKIGEKLGVEVIFHTGKSRNGGNKKEFIESRFLCPNGAVLGNRNKQAG
jgi:hypothetical protein